MSTEPQLQACPYCFEAIQPQAVICRFCHTGLSAELFKVCPFCAEVIKKNAKICRFCKCSVTETVEAGAAGNGGASAPSRKSKANRRRSKDGNQQFEKQPERTAAPAPPVPPLPSPDRMAPPVPSLPPPERMAPPVPSLPEQRMPLFNLDDNAMNNIFESLGVKEKTSQPINLGNAVQQVRALADVEGVSRLARVPTTSADEPVGKIDGIGKFLLDAEEVDAIGSLASGKRSRAHLKRILPEQATELYAIMQEIGSQPGVIGCVIIGYDGLLIANSLPNRENPESIGALAMSIHINTTNLCSKMQHGAPKQLTCKTEGGCVVISDFGGGILTTVIDPLTTDKLVSVIDFLSQLT